MNHKQYKRTIEKEFMKAMGNIIDTFEEKLQEEIQNRIASSERNVKRELTMLLAKLFELHDFIQYCKDPDQYEQEHSYIYYHYEKKEKARAHDQNDVLMSLYEYFELTCKDSPDDYRFVDQIIEIIDEHHIDQIYEVAKKLYDEYNYILTELMEKYNVEIKINNEQYIEEIEWYLRDYFNDLLEDLGTEFQDKYTNPNMIIQLLNEGFKSNPNKYKKEMDYFQFANKERKIQLNVTIEEYGQYLIKKKQEIAHRELILSLTLGLALKNEKYWTDEYEELSNQGSSLEYALEYKTRDIQVLEEEISETIQGSIIYYSKEIITYLNSLFQAEIAIDYVTASQIIYMEGTIGLLRRKGLLTGLYHNILEQMIPDHPKDEYPEARSMDRKFVIHYGPTNSGKTHHAVERLKECRTGVYLAPLRLLAYEMFYRINADRIPCNLLTGEEEVTMRSAMITSSTVEKLDTSQMYDICVIDEAQLISDEQRGYAWARAILGVLAKEIHVCCSEDAVEIIERLIGDCKDTVQKIKYERQTPLEFVEEKYDFPKDVQKGDALIVFSRYSALKVSALLKEHNINTSIIYGNLPPDTRRRQMERFLEGEANVVVSTDAIGMGLNLPIQRIVFLEQEKFDGREKRFLKPKEIQQIAGRAGRYGIYPKGYVTSLRKRKQVKYNFELPVHPITKVYIAPNEQTLLNLPYGSIGDRLMAWKTYQFKFDLFQKKDIEQELTLEKMISDYTEEWGLSNVLNAISIPFDFKSEELRSLWYAYIMKLIEGNRELEFPWCNGDQLDDLEIYYKKLDLYYAIHKRFDLPFDEEQLKAEKDETSENIHTLLIQSIKKFTKKCKKCGAKLPWDYLHGYCESCYNKVERNYYR